jgi:hypothetical protein
MPLRPGKELITSGSGLRGPGAGPRERKKTGITAAPEPHVDIGYESLSAYIMKVLDREKLNITIENVAPSVRDSTAKIRIYCYDIELSDNLGFSTLQTEYTFHIHYLITFNGMENRLAGKLCVLLTRAIMEHEQFKIIGKKIDFGDWRAFDAIAQPYVLVKIPMTVIKDIAAAALVREPLVVKTELLRQ